jgi:hypothetical protein
MKLKFFLLKLPDDSICPCCHYYKKEGGFVCLVEDALNTYGHYNCDGKLDNRPKWCPLKPVREAKSNDYDRSMVWVEE